ncbi:2-desacetyl-2-hydroxyethyl bacteriochlorophyllide A dehydrogenase [Microbacterium sp. cf046]|uniref:zinc-binding dehydrogenase n=1 Tax=Microbacterium sp. cf046 TaxID=1761803 RepID=UPI0008F35B1B|nr:zinc-binding dehydrogenase [Microbacterium sp. cf046]SFR93074.1 2-desacetyl-2-hydroxyethyl bacteriochlorophyllide A dehydrogenase [Microbacterium sp. cf046]
MGLRITFPEARTVSVVDDPEPGLSAGEVRVRTLFSGISAGTELTAYRGTSPHVTKHWNAESRLFADGAAEPAFPVTTLGYEEVGEIVEVADGVSEVEIGDRVWGTWGHRTSAVLTAASAADRVLPADADPRVGIFSHIGAVALNAVIDADIHVGEWVAVFGLGVPGQLVAQLARLNGARVIAVDGIASRRELALRLGAEVALDPSDAVAETIRELTRGRGADVAIEISGNARALHEAIRSVAYNSRVVAAGFLQGDAVGLRLGEEFHHNRVQLVCSQISGPAPSVSHRWDRYRLNSTVIGLAAAGRIDALSLISSTVQLDEAADVYRMLDENPRDALQVVIDMGGTR